MKIPVGKFGVWLQRYMACSARGHVYASILLPDGGAAGHQQCVSCGITRPAVKNDAPAD
jgi:hypothetical protein